jgi:tellurite resistance protein
VRRIVAELGALPIELRRFVAGFAYVLGRTAHADLSVSDEEQSLMEHTVMDVAGLTEAQAVLVVEIARNQAELYGQTEDYLVTRELANASTREQRERLLRCAFAIGAADGSISSAESAELNEIGKELGFTVPEVDAIRLEFKDQLSAVQAIRRMNVNGG